jgi:hypothetical protein
MFFLSHLPFSFFETSFMFNLRRPVPRTNKNKDKEKKEQEQGTSCWLIGAGVV